MSHSPPSVKSNHWVKWHLNPRLRGLGAPELNRGIRELVHLPTICLCVLKTVYNLIIKCLKVSPIKHWEINLHGWLETRPFSFSKPSGCPFLWQNTSNTLIFFPSNPHLVCIVGQPNPPARMQWHLFTGKQRTVSGLGAHLTQMGQTYVLLEKAESPESNTRQPEYHKPYIS